MRIGHRLAVERYRWIAIVEDRIEGAGVFIGPIAVIIAIPVKPRFNERGVGRDATDNEVSPF